MKVELSVSALLTLAVSLITVGLQLVKSGSIAYGVTLVGVGFGIMVLSVYLIYEGIVRKFMSLLGRK